MSECLVSIDNYGDYSTGNYDSSRRVRIGELELYFSYKTIVAFSTPEQGLVARENEWGPTTGKHLNKIGVPKNQRLPRESFELQLKHALIRSHLWKVE